MNQRLREVLKTHKFVSGLSLSGKSYREAVLRHLSDLFLEDFNENGDLTTQAVLSKSQKIKAVLISKQAGILAGMSEILFFLKNGRTFLPGGKLFDNINVSRSLSDGSAISKGAVLCVLDGKASHILKLERTLLNFLQHMSGVATMAHHFTEQCKNYPVLVCPTRKTPWGLLDKKACLLGGAGTHRLNLSDAVLVKDTHLDLLQHDFDALEKLLRDAPRLGRFVEIEVESSADAKKAFQTLQNLQKIRDIPCFIMLDNMNPRRIEKIIGEFKRLPRKTPIYFEASGGITLQNIKQYAKTGVDVLSAGAMTHSAPALDISLKILREN